MSQFAEDATVREITILPAAAAFACACSGRCRHGLYRLGTGGDALRDGVGRNGVTGAAEPASTGTLPDGAPDHPPRVKNVIWLFMVGGTSHMESFDPKPALNTYAGKTFAETPYKGVLNSP